MKGNKQIYSNHKNERIKGYKKLLTSQKELYIPPKHIAKGIVEAMEAQGYNIDLKQAIAYMKSSYAVFDRDYYENKR
tara:strand:- start:252 stop:482 length:231 start_codon:yes stop_codon:yes gene_type:complete